MSLINKPDYEVFASNARDGEVLPIPDVLRGWGETILLTEKIPPMEWFNWLAKRQDEWLLYLTQQGIAEWSDKVTYPTAAIAKFNGLFYVSIKETKGDNPSATQSAWKLLTEYFNIDGKLDKTEVKQTIGQSTASVMSQKAVTDAINTKSVEVSQQTGESTKVVMSQKAVTDNLFAVEQEYKNVKQSRRLGAEYINGSNKSIFVIVSGLGATDRYSGFNVHVNGILITTSTSYGQGSRPNVSFIVPSGSRYKVSLSSTSQNISVENWFELS